MKGSQLQEYDQWLAKHLDELVAQYPGKVVAIQEGKVLFNGDTEVEVYQQIRKAGYDCMPLVFRVPQEEDVQAILWVDAGENHA